MDAGTLGELGWCFGRDFFGEGNQVGIEFKHPQLGTIAAARVEEVLAGFWVAKHKRVDRLEAMAASEQRFAGIHERPSRSGSSRHADAGWRRVLGTHRVVEEHLALGPDHARCPGTVMFDTIVLHPASVVQTKHRPLLFPLLEILRRPRIEFPGASAARGEDPNLLIENGRMRVRAAQDRVFGTEQRAEWE